MAIKLNFSRFYAGLKNLKPGSTIKSPASGATTCSPLKDGLARLSGDSDALVKNRLKSDTVQFNKKTAVTQAQPARSHTSSQPGTPPLQDKAAASGAKISAKPAESVTSNGTSASYHSAQSSQSQKSKSGHKTRSGQGTQALYDAEKPLNIIQEIDLLAVKPTGKRAPLTEANVGGLAAKPLSLKDKMAQYFDHPQASFIPAKPAYMPIKPEGVAWTTAGYDSMLVPYLAK